MLIIPGKPYRLIVADRNKSAVASHGPVCACGEHARATLDQIVEQVREARKEMELDEDFAVVLMQIPVEEVK